MTSEQWLGIRAALAPQLGWTLAYSAVLAVAVFVAFKVDGSGGWRSAIMLVPLIPAAGLLRSTVRQFRRMDEMLVRKQLEAVAWAFGAALFLMVAYALLEVVGWPRLPMFVPLIALNLIWTVCIWTQWLRYR